MYLRLKDLRVRYNTVLIFNMNFAASRQVNYSGASPKLTEEQVWKGLEIKARDPKRFVAAITYCEVISDTSNKVCFGSCFFLIYGSLTV